MAMKLKIQMKEARYNRENHQTVLEASLIPSNVSKMLSPLASENKHSAVDQIV